MSLSDEAQPGEPTCTLGLIKDRVEQHFRIVLSLGSVCRLARSPGFRKMPPRPCHPGADPRKREDFRKNFSALAKFAMPEAADPAVPKTRGSGVRGLRARPGSFAEDRSRTGGAFPCQRGERQIAERMGAKDEGRPLAFRPAP